jgi:hypothetical protein
VRRGLRKKTGLAKQLAQKQVGFRAVRIRFRPRAYRNERVVDCARSLEPASLGDPSPHRPLGGVRHSAERGRRFGAQPPAQIDLAEPNLRGDEIRLQRHRGLVALHRVRYLAQIIQDDRSKMMRGRETRVEPEGGRERFDSLFQPPRGRQSDAEVMVGHRRPRIEFDRSLEQGDRLCGAPFTDEACAGAGAALGLVRPRRRYFRGRCCARRRPADACRIRFREKGLKINGGLGARDEIRGARRLSGSREARRASGKRDSPAPLLR